MAKRKSTKYTTKTKDRVTRTLLKTGDAKLYSYLFSKKTDIIVLTKELLLKYVRIHICPYIHKLCKNT
jgi:hypothetical protein